MRLGSLRAPDAGEQPRGRTRASRGGRPASRQHIRAAPRHRKAFTSQDLTASDLGRAPSPQPQARPQTPEPGPRHPWAPPLSACRQLSCGRAALDDQICVFKRNWNLDFYVNSPGSINKRRSVVETAHVHRQRASFLMSALWGAWFLHLFLLCSLLYWRQPKYSLNCNPTLGTNRPPGEVLPR